MDRPIVGMPLKVLDVWPPVKKSPTVRTLKKRH
jgi:hypothetical protein